MTNFGRPANCHILINPANAQLSGVKNFPYFPRGGPVPTQSGMSMKENASSNWGGLEVGSGMLFPASVVDGLVHAFGGSTLETECKQKQKEAGDENACPVGSAVMTTSGDLHIEYDAVVHTTPPFFSHDESPEEMLASCYRNAFDLAFANHARAAIPLIGAGARGFPEDVAIRIAAEQSVRWCNSDCYNDDDDGPRDQKAIAFALLEQRLVDEMIIAVEGTRSE